MNKQDREAQARLIRLGIDPEDAHKLHLIERALNRWFALECGDGDDNGSWAIERDEQTDKPYFVHHHYFHGKREDYTTRRLIQDREKGARKRLAAIMAKYPNLTPYVQGDPRGGALWILRNSEDLSWDFDKIDSLYTRGVAV